MVRLGTGASTGDSVPVPGFSYNGNPGWKEDGLWVPRIQALRPFPHVVRVRVAAEQRLQLIEDLMNLR
jgi:hypothetical protein